jgi:hypothetical protein
LRTSIAIGEAETTEPSRILDPQQLRPNIQDQLFRNWQEGWPPGDDDDNNTRLRRVKLWLESLASGNWIVVIDNLDDLGLIIMRYIPVRHGTILFTTRDARIIGHPRYLPSRAGVQIVEMSDQEALETFSRLLGATADRKMSKVLLDRIEKLPLAIAQAAAYIRETGISLGKYLELFQECEQNQRDLLNQALPNAIEGSRLLLVQ